MSLTPEEIAAVKKARPNVRFKRKMDDGTMDYYVAYGQYRGSKRHL